MPLKPLDFKPGFVRDETQYRAKESWWDGNNVRFRNGRPEMIGGWVARNSTAMIGACRALHRNISADGFNVVISGTESGLYQAIDTGAGLTFISCGPTSYVVNLGANPMLIGGSYIRLIVPDLFKFSVGDTITLSGLTTFGGNSTGALNVAYVVIGIFSYLSLALVSGSLAAGGYGGGSSATATVSMVNRTAAVKASLGSRYWSIASYGGAVVACERNGPIYYWDGNSSSGNSFYLRNASSVYNNVLLGTVVGNANGVPSAAICVGVGEDRSLIAFGCNDPSIPQTAANLIYGRPFSINRRLVTWSDAENPFDWDDREDNTAGTLEIQSGIEIITAVSTRREHVIFMDSCLMSMKYIGAPDYYGIDKIADNVTIIGPNAVMAVGDTLFWMGPNNFYVYNGVVQPVPCPVSRYVFSNINRAQLSSGIQDPAAYRVATCHNVEYNEIWWFYPSGSSTENDRYVVYNYLEKVWFIGAMARTAALPTEATYPLMTGTDGKLYKHEYLYSDNGSPISAFIESGDMDIGEGDHFTTATRFIPDHAFSGNTSAFITYQIKRRDAPMAAWEAGTGKKTVAATENPVDTRVRGRELALRVASSTTDAKWTLGRPRLDIQPDGKK